MARDYLADYRKAKDEGLISSDLTFTKLQVMLPLGLAQLFKIFYFRRDWKI